LPSASSESLAQIATPSGICSNPSLSTTAIDEVVVLPNIAPLSYFETQVEPDEIAVGIRRCAYYGPPSPLETQWADIAPLRIGADHAAHRYHFEFFSDPAIGRSTLYRIVLYTSIDARDEIIEALTGRFGAPTETTTLPMQNGLGARYAARGVRWQNAISTITVIATSGHRNRMSVSYTLREVAETADRAVQDRQRNATDRM
jgi:hypothetical protein